jgi:hypothetical protein
MTPAEELLRLAKEALARGDAVTIAEAYTLVARQHPALYARYQVSPQQPVVKRQADPPPELVSKAEREHWAIVQLNAKVEAVLQQLPRLPRHSAYARVLKTPEGAALARAYDDHRRALITAHQARS